MKIGTSDRVLKFSAATMFLFASTLFFALNSFGDLSPNASKSELVKALDQGLKAASEQVMYFQANYQVLLAQAKNLAKEKRQIAQISKKIAIEKGLKKTEELNNQYQNLNTKFNENLEKFVPGIIALWIAGYSANVPTEELLSEWILKPDEVFAKTKASADPQFKQLHIWQVVDRKTFAVKMNSNLPGILCANNYYRIEGGKFGKTVISDDYLSSFQAFKSSDEYREITRELSSKVSAKIVEVLNSISDGVYSFCTLAALSGITVRGNNIALGELAQNFANADFKDQTTFQKSCIEGAPSDEQVSRLLELEKGHGSIKNINSIVEAKKICNRAVGILCSDSYVIKDTVIMNYVTKSCKVRKVTKSDIENDIQSWTSVGVEEAARLEHSQFLDRIGVCQAAFQKGYTWEHKEVKVLPDCKPGQ